MNSRQFCSIPLRIVTRKVFHEKDEIYGYLRITMVRCSSLKRIEGCFLSNYLDVLYDCTRILQPGRVLMALKPVQYFHKDHRYTITANNSNVT